MKLAGTRLQHHPSRAGLTIDTKAGPVWNGQVRLNEQWLDQPRRWKRPRMIFVVAHGDLFYAPEEMIDRTFDAMEAAPWHIYQILTKRTEAMLEYVRRRGSRRPPKIWWGTSAEDHKHAELRVSHLLKIPLLQDDRFFVSAEPLLGHINLRWLHIGNGIYLDALTGFHSSGMEIASFEDVSKGALNALPVLPGPTGHLHLVIAGGENGPRPTHPDWVRSLRDQTKWASAAFHFKQWGSWAPIPRRADLPGNPAMVRAGDCLVSLEGQSHVLSGDLGSPLEGEGSAAMRRIGKAKAGAMLDGREWREIPA